MSSQGNNTRLSVSTRSNQRKISECSDTSEDGRPQFFIGSFDEREKNIKETRRSLKNGSVKKLKDKPVIIESNNSPHKNNVENDVKVSSQTADVVVKEQENKITSTKDNVHSTDFDVDPEDPIYKTPEIEEFDENARIPKDVSSQTLKQDDFKYHESDIAIEDDTPVQHQDGGGDQPSALNSVTSTEAMDHDNVIPAAGSTTDKEANRVAHTETVLRTDNQSQSDANSNSYISTDSTVLDGDITVSNSNIPRPDSLSLPKPLQFYERQKGEAEQGESLVSPTTTDSISSMTERLLQAATSTPLQDQGILTKEGDMIEFVAEDLTEKIRMSSPLSKSADTPSSSGRVRSTTSSYSISSFTSQSSSTTTSGWTNMSNSGMSRSPSVLTQSPEDIPPIDPRVVLDLELQAKAVASSLDVMMTTLRGALHKMSGMTSGCIGAYQQAIDSTCDTVDGSIKSMYALMAKCEELSKSMQPVYKIAEQIKEMKRLLDLFESQVAKDMKDDSKAA